MSAERSAQRRGLRALTGIAVGFRAFYAVAVDGGNLYGSGWISALMGAALALPVVLVTEALCGMTPKRSAQEALKAAVGRAGASAAGIVLFVIFAYDAGVMLQMMSSAAKYVAMPEANRNLLKVVTATVAATAAFMGAAAAADAALIWRKIAAVLIGLLALAQCRYYRPEWLTPVLGPGVRELVQSAFPAAGMFCFAAAGRLLLDEAPGKEGGTMTGTMIGSGVAAAALIALLGMLVPGMTEEPETRSFRLGRLLVNDRAGLSLEMPYVALIYGCMLLTLIFEMQIAAKALGLASGGWSARGCMAAAGVAALAVSVSGAAESEAVRSFSQWYYPLAAVPAAAAAAAARIGNWFGRREKT